MLAWWSGDGAKVNSLYVERGEQTLRLLEEDPVSGAVREVLNESGPTYLESNLDYGGSPERPRQRDERRGPLVLRAERLGAPVPLRCGRSADERRDLGRLGRADARRRRRRLDILHGRRPGAGSRPVLPPPLPGSRRRRQPHAPHPRGRRPRGLVLPRRERLRGHVLARGRTAADGRSGCERHAPARAGGGRHLLPDVARLETAGADHGEGD